MHSDAADVSRLVLALIGLIAATLCSPAHAWGSRGHRITGQVAEALLTGTARREVRALLEQKELDTAATFMDAEREALEQRWPESPRWHYDNWPACGSESRYCADGHCATRQIERFRKVLGDRSAPQSERALALKLLVHMLGDLHQPLHMADNADRGGNDVQVELDGKVYRLHEVFDTVSVKQVGGKHSARRYAASLLKRYDARVADWRRGTLGDWAQESHALAVREVYGALPGFACNAHSPDIIELSPAYLQRMREYIPEQLTKAGIRIAVLLNRTL